MFLNTHPLDVSCDTSSFEVAADRDANGQLTPKCARIVCEHIDRDGFAIVQNFLTDEECAAGLKTLIRLAQFGKKAAIAYRLIQTCPKKGTIIIYRSDILHAGPDNRSNKPRSFLNINIARDVIHPETWKNGYALHSSFLSTPMTLWGSYELSS